MNILNFFRRLKFSSEPPHQPQEISKSLRVKYLRQIITKDSRNSRTIMFNAENELKNARLEYFLIGEDAANFADITANFFEPEFIYACTLENLKPASLYKFRVIADNCATDWQNLRTAGNGEFEMLIFSDSQCLDYAVWKNTADIAAKNFPDAELFLVNGDLVDTGQDFNQWRDWYNAAAELLRERILAPVIGNHECYDTNWMPCAPTAYLNNFKLPSNGIKDFGGYFYAFDYGAANFFVLNTQFMELEKIKSSLPGIQEYWFKRAVANSNRPWRIVFMHKAIYNRQLTDFVDEAKDYFMRLFDELEIDLVFTGHLHTYRNRGRINKTFYILCGRAGDQNYTGEPNFYIDLKIRAGDLTLTCQSVDGKILDNFTLKK